MAVTTVFFDLDDTLINDSEATYQALFAACELAQSHAHIQADELCQAVWDSARQLWRASSTFTYCHAMGISATEGLCASFTGDDPHLQELQQWAPGYRLQAWSQALAHCGIDDTSLTENLVTAFIHQRFLAQSVYPEVATALAALRPHYQLGLITNGAPDLQRAKFQKSQLEPYFDVAIVSGEIGIGKPDPAIFRHALQMLSARPEEAVMIGDSLSRDIDGAHNAGMRGLLIKRPGWQGNKPQIVPDGELTGLLPLKEMLEALPIVGR